MRKAKRKCQKCKTHVRETAERHQPPEEDELSLNGDSDSDSCQCKEGSNEQVEEGSDEDGLKKDIENDVNFAEQTGKPIGINLAKIINNVIQLQ